MKNAKHQNTLIRLHFGVSDTVRLRSQELRLINTGVPELRNECEILKEGDCSRYRELKCQNTSPQESRNHKMGNAKIPKAGDSFRYWSFGYWEMEESSVDTPHHRSPEVAK
jgi:hypothetical protein